MTGHDKDIVINKELTKGFPINGSFAVEERAALRKYIVENGGMLFFDDCGYHGQFARQVAVEFGKIFPVWICHQTERAENAPSGEVQC